jgi:hypothetical protein
MNDWWRIADELAAAIEAFMRGDGNFADRMAEALDNYRDEVERITRLARP